MRRKTRFVCVSDTHGYTPSEAGFKMPAGDVLIHAGDLTNNGSMSELHRTMDWISKADFEIKIIVAGNHDVSLDPEFYARHGHAFHGQKLEDPQQCMNIVTGAAPSIIFLQHQAAVIRLTRENGPCTAFTIFGSPYSQFQGSWAFGYESSDAAAIWEQIPPYADIVVTHTPPQSYCDQKPDGKFVGCDALRQTLSCIRPPLAICGHVHEGRSYKRVRWRDAGAVDRGEDGETESSGRIDQVIHGTLPPRGNKKLNLVDLTGKRGNRLDTHGFSFEAFGSHLLSKDTTAPVIMLSRKAESGVDAVPDEQSNQANKKSSMISTLSMQECTGSFRSARRETCVVNASIMATSWPHREGKQFNVPVVVDIELPVHSIEGEK